MFRKAAIDPTKTTQESSESKTVQASSPAATEATSVVPGANTPLKEYLTSGGKTYLGQSIDRVRSLLHIPAANEYPDMKEYNEKLLQLGAWMTFKAADDYLKRKGAAPKPADFEFANFHVHGTSAVELADALGTFIDCDAFVRNGNRIEAARAGVAYVPEKEESHSEDTCQARPSIRP